jgi:hypothetical protein
MKIQMEHEWEEGRVRKGSRVHMTPDYVLEGRQGVHENEE